MSYPLLVQPVLDLRCVECHKPGGEAPEGPPGGGPLMDAVFDLHQDGTDLLGDVAHRYPDFVGEFRGRLDIHALHHPVTADIRVHNRRQRQGRGPGRKVRIRFTTCGERLLVVEYANLTVVN